MLRIRLRSWALALGVLPWLAACERGHDRGLDREAVAERLDDVLPPPGSREAPLPADRAAILRELSPLPAEALVVVYALRAPGGVTGTLEVLARPGGFRRENWTIEVPMGVEGTRQLEGSTIQTPDGVWIEGTAPTAVRPSPLGALADAYLALDPAKRRAVVERLRARRELLARARASEAETPERVLDVPCRVTRVATIELCLWEETGLPLRYHGHGDDDGLSLRAISIDDQAGIGERAFALPPGAPTGAPEGLDPAAALHRLAQGDLAELAPYLHPGLRLPS